MLSPFIARGARQGPTAVLATSLAVLSWLGVYAEGIISFQRSFATGYGFAHASFVFLRFFTNSTVILVGMVMTATAWRSWRSRPLLPPALYAAVLVYILVVSTTYEVLLRRLWSPHGIWFLRDALMHDAIPALTLVFWLFCAPKTSLPWSQPLIWLCYPSIYIASVIVAGRLGQGYPYPFLDLDTLGCRDFVWVVVGFTSVFLIFGFVVRGLSARWSRQAGNPLSNPVQIS